MPAQATLEHCLVWLDRFHEVVAAAQPQQGEASYYRRRRPADSELDPQRSLAEQFQLLRVVDNACYPAFFHWRGRRYELQMQPGQTQTHQLSQAEIPHCRVMPFLKRASMREVLTVSSRGQITLPAEMRRHLGIDRVAR